MTADSPTPPQPAPPPVPLSPSALYRRCDPAQFKFKTTADLEPLDGILGQARAVEAVGFGLTIRRPGYNLFVLGPPGTGKRSVVQHFTRRQAESGATPADWVYVNNFAEPHKPRALQLPAGRGVRFRQDMRDLIEELKAAIPAIFESDDYRTRRHAIDEQFKEKNEQAFGEIEQRAREHQIAIIRTPMGMALAPTKDQEVLGHEDFAKLSEAEQKRLRDQMNALQEQLQETLRHVPEWESERREKIRALNRQVTQFAIGHLISGLTARYGDLANVLDHLKVVEGDLIEHADQLLPQPAGGPEGPAELLAARRSMGPEGSLLDRYQVNLMVDHSATRGAPVVEEDHPSLQNLIGRVEYRAQFGALIADFTLIKPGALHLANGGYLVLDARRVLLQAFAWEELKRILRSREIRIQSVGEMMGLVSTATLQPEAIPLDVKVILMGDRQLYYLLSELDPDFRELFKVAADFDDEMDRLPDSEIAYARLIAMLGRRENLRPLDAPAVARVIERGARLAGDSGKISARVEMIADLLREADHLAVAAGRGVISAPEIDRAISAQERRAGRIRDRTHEEIRRGTLMIDSAGVRVGQVNGLSVLELGGFAFGRPSRISARVRLGKGEVVDIEREVELGGPIHSKGVLILAGFLGQRYARHRPLSLSASLVFEQSYGGVEGDSASMAELCAILSALADAPIRQAFAITGSVNQNGEAQAIGGVNEKIEGFFDICHARGLTGEQGVIIPESNIKHLMLRADVVDAATTGRFSIHAVRNVDEALAILIGLEPGVRGPDGQFPPGTVNRRVEDELAALAAHARSFATPERPAPAP